MRGCVKMPTIFDHVKYYRNKSFNEEPFNDVDALVLTELTFLKFDESLISLLPLSLEEVGKYYFAKNKKSSLKGKYRVYVSSYKLLSLIYDAPRYKNIQVSDYAKKIDKETQFGALTFRYFAKWVYVNFEGTNDRLSGWKEDLLLASDYPLVCQLLATDYLKNTLKVTDKKIYVGGHSKGANLAVSSVILAPPIYRQKIYKIYDFDGPGFREDVYNSRAYQTISKKIVKYVPELSTVGMVLYSKEERNVVKSTAKGIMQHDGCTWECYGNYFVEGKLSPKSVAFSKKIKEFVKESSDESLNKSVKAIFKVFDEAGVDSIEKINITKILKCINHAKELKTDEETKNNILKSLNIMLSLYKI